MDKSRGGSLAGSGFRGGVMQDAYLEKEYLEQEKRKYETIWNRDPYRITSPGLLTAPSFLSEMGSKLQPGDSVTDFGCGTGASSLLFLERGLNVRLVDIASNCLDEKIRLLSVLAPERLSFTQAPLWDLPDETATSDWIYCIDVLEHIPGPMVTRCLRSMSRKTRKGGALQVFLEDEGMGRMIGETLHLTIQPLDWWIEQISSFWTIDKIVEIIPEIRYLIYVGAPVNGETKNPDRGPGFDR